MNITFFLHTHMHVDENVCLSCPHGLVLDVRPLDDPIARRVPHSLHDGVRQHLDPQRGMHRKLHVQLGREHAPDQARQAGQRAAVGLLLPNPVRSVCGSQHRQQ